MKSFNSKFKKYRLFKNEKGYSLASLVAGLPLATLVFLIVTLAMVNFVKTYHETRLFTQLQEDVFQAIETMKFGYAVDGVSDNYGLIGLMTAQKVEISNTNDSVKLTPVIVNPGQPFNASYYLDSKGVIRSKGSYAFQSYMGSNHPIFPESSQKIGQEQQFRCDELEFSAVKQTATGDPTLVKVRIVASVRFREKLDGESIDEDLKSNLRTIEYETLVHIANAILD